MYCKNCGKEINDSASYCPTCGVSTGAAPQATVQQPVINVVNNGFGYIHKKKWLAFLLCLFLGYLGVHRFYVGKVGTGIIWLFTCGFFGLGWMFDLIFILFGGFKDRAGQPLI